MPPVRRFAIVGVVVAGLLAASCGGEGEPLGPTATVPQAPPTTDPYAIPPVIDEAYVNRVLAGLDHSTGDVVRLVVETRVISQEAVDRVSALYAQEGLTQDKVELLRDDLNQGFPGLRIPTGNPRSAVIEILAASEQCIFVAVDRDYSELNDRPVDLPSREWIAIQRTSDTPGVFNPTGWEYIYEGFESGGLRPNNPCEHS